MVVAVMVVGGRRVPSVGRAFMVRFADECKSGILSFSPSQSFRAHELMRHVQLNSVRRGGGAAAPHVKPTADQHQSLFLLLKKKKYSSKT